MQEPSEELLRNVRIGFIGQGTSMHKWCLENDFNYKNVHKLLRGTWDGEKAKEWRKLIVEASGCCDGTVD